MNYFPPVAQDERELADLLVEIDGVQPASIVEVGVWQGGVLARLQARYPAAMIVGIDPAPMLSPDLPATFPCVVLGCSQDRAVRQRAESENGGEPFDVVILDGDHSGPSVREDWEWAQREVLKLVAFHDIGSAGYTCAQPGFGVNALWKEIVESGHYRTHDICYDANGYYGFGVVWL